MSTRLNIVKAVTALLQEITPDNGHHTNIGPNVFRGREGYQADDPLPMISIIEDPDMINAETEQRNPTIHDVELKLIIQGFAYEDSENPSDAVYELLADIKRVVAQEYVMNGGRGELEKNLLGLGNVVRSFQVGQGCVLPYDSDIGGTQAAMLLVTIKYLDDVLQ